MKTIGLRGLIMLCLAALSTSAQAGNFREEYSACLAARCESESRVEGDARGCETRRFYYTSSGFKIWKNYTCNKNLEKVIEVAEGGYRELVSCFTKRYPHPKILDVIERTHQHFLERGGVDVMCIKGRSKMVGMGIPYLGWLRVYEAGLGGEREQLRSLGAHEFMHLTTTVGYGGSLSNRNALSHWLDDETRGDRVYSCEKLCVPDAELSREHCNFCLSYPARTGSPQAACAGILSSEELAQLRDARGEVAVAEADFRDRLAVVGNTNFVEEDGGEEAALERSAQMLVTSAEASARKYAEVLEAFRQEPRIVKLSTDGDQFRRVAALLPIATECFRLSRRLRLLVDAPKIVASLRAGATALRRLIAVAQPQVGRPLDRATVCADESTYPGGGGAALWAAVRRNQQQALAFPQLVLSDKLNEGAVARLLALGPVLQEAERSAELAKVDATAYKGLFRALVTRESTLKALLAKGAGAIPYFSIPVVKARLLTLADVPKAADLNALVSCLTRNEASQRCLGLALTRHSYASPINHLYWRLQSAVKNLVFPQ